MALTASLTKQRLQTSPQWMGKQENTQNTFTRVQSSLLTLYEILQALSLRVVCPPWQSRSLLRVFLAPWQSLEIPAVSAFAKNKCTLSMGLMYLQSPKPEFSSTLIRDRGQQRG
jgi:hypothetical protein